MVAVDAVETRAVEDEDVDEVDMDAAVVREIPRYVLSVCACATVLIHQNQENATTAPAPAATAAPEENPNQNQRGQKVPFLMTLFDLLMLTQVGPQKWTKI